MYNRTKHLLRLRKPRTEPSARSLRGERAAAYIPPNLRSARVSAVAEFLEDRREWPGGGRDTAQVSAAAPEYSGEILHAPDEMGKGSSMY